VCVSHSLYVCVPVCLHSVSVRVSPSLYVSVSSCVFLSVVCQFLVIGSSALRAQRKEKEDEKFVSDFELPRVAVLVCCQLSVVCCLCPAVCCSKYIST